MNERYIPTRDLKAGFRVVNAIGKGVYKETEPILTVYFSKKCAEFMDSINIPSRKKFF